jgi:hypothetical protein
MKDSCSQTKAGLGMIVIPKKKKKIVWKPWEICLSL